MERSLELVLQALPLLCRGMLMTLSVLGCSAVLALVLGTLMGTFLCGRLRLKLLTPTLEAVSSTLRGVPLMVQLLLVYFVLPDLLKIHLEPFTAAWISLGCCSSGYVAHIVRGALNKVPQTQWESALTLGLSTPQMVRWIIFPQAIKTALPALGNELDSLLKSTAIVSSIGVLELTRAGMNVVSRNMEPVGIYITLALLYLILSLSVNSITRFFERRLRWER